ncbi:MAG: YqgE/AlgH family protein [Woeseiaceae bacterium]
MARQHHPETFTLANHFIIAMPTLDDPNFEKSVSYICEYNDEGAMGVIINQLADITFKELCDQLEIEILDSEVEEIPIFIGGPVEIDRGFILHSPIGDWESTLAVSNDVGLTMSKDIIQAIAEGYDSDNAPPKHYMVILGYAGWSEEQIEYEISENVWLNVPANNDILFNTPIEKRWSAAAATLGINIQQLSTDIGHA